MNHTYLGPLLASSLLISQAYRHLGSTSDRAVQERWRSCQQALQEETHAVRERQIRSSRDSSRTISPVKGQMTKLESLRLHGSPASGSPKIAARGVVDITTTAGSSLVDPFISHHRKSVSQTETEPRKVSFCPIAAVSSLRVVRLICFLVSPHFLVKIIELSVPCTSKPWSMCGSAESCICQPARDKSRYFRSEFPD